MATIILVHGGTHGGWCWEEVAPILEAAGHDVLVPDLPGSGADPTPRGTVTLAMTGAFIAGLARRQREPVILVGHSLGGLTISQAAEDAPEAVLGLVYVAALLLPNGSSMTSFFGDDLAIKDAAPARDGILELVSADFAIRHFYNRTDPATASRAIARLTPQPFEPLVAPVRVSDARFGHIPRAYVECLDDQSLPVALQRRMEETLPCDPVYAMDSDHSPFLSAPRLLADHLLDATARFAR